MPSLHPSIPRAVDVERFRVDPLAFLTRARAKLGDIFVLREEGPILSRSPDCRGVVAVFGAERQRAVLADIGTFGMPPTAAKQLALDASLTNLNRSLHSMRGEEHAAQKRVLTSIIDTADAEVGEIAVPWKTGDTIELLSAMRELTRRVAAGIMFGGGGEELADLLLAYFHLRREVASPVRAAGEEARTALVEMGAALDDALRRFIRASPSGLVGRLAAAGLSEDEIVGHANILFISSSEPIAVALTWTLLILSQLPALRGALSEDATLLDRVISESLRILPPNAFMVRLTTRPATLCGVALPEECEVVLSPFVSHRDPARFPDPDVFMPSRWASAHPSSYEYFPFGAGGHACVGRGLALHLMKRILSSVLGRHDLVLAGDQEIDWRIEIMLLPNDDPRFVVRAPGDRTGGGKLRGRVAELFAF